MVSKILTKKIISIEKKLAKGMKEHSINKRILKKIGSEASVLGKAQLISNQIIFLNKKLPKSGANIRERIQNQLIFYYIELYKLNHKIHDALSAELRADAKLLKNRITTKLGHKEVYADLFYKIRDIAAKTVKDAQYHVKRYYAGVSNRRAHFLLARKSLKRLSIIHRLLKSDESILSFRKILLIKTMKMFHILLNLSKKNAKLIVRQVSNIEKSRNISGGKSYQQIIKITDEQIKELHRFAREFNSYIIHNEPFYANGKKHILITHKVKPVF